MPYQEVIHPDDNQRDYITFLLVGDGDSEVVESIRAKFASAAVLRLNHRPQFNWRSNGFEPVLPVSPEAAARVLPKIGPAKVELTRLDEYVPTDDWPFLYLREPAIPALNLRGMAIVAVLSLVILLAFAPVRRARPSGRMFFLGAGFMLLETKGVVHMALLFGSTWVVNSIVFFAILSMILLSNLYVLAVRPRRLWPYYLLLLAALLTQSHRAHGYVPVAARREQGRLRRAWSFTCRCSSPA